MKIVARLTVIAIILPLLCGACQAIGAGSTPIPPSPIIEPTPTPIPTIDPAPISEMERLEIFLAEDKTDWHPYTDSYTCVDYARDLSLAALEEDFEVAIVYVRWWPEWSAHKLNAFRVDGQVVFVEPQSDQIMEEIRVGDIYLDKQVWQVQIHWATQ